MTEAEWLTCDDPTAMLEYLGADNICERKLRLFVVTCCHRIWHLLKEEGSRNAVDAAERYAEGRFDELALQGLAEIAARVIGRVSLDSEAAEYAATAAAGAASRGQFSRTAEAAAVAAGVALAPEAWLPAKWDEQAIQCTLLREMVGSLPFREIRRDQRWLAWSNETVVKIAQAIYDDRAFDRLPILADALEDAGCDNTDILRHCRESGEHVRGCWVVDLLLGKS